MKVKVIRKFFDKQSRKIRLFGDIIEVNDNRYKELQGFVKKDIDKNKEDKSVSKEQA